ncbi:hypothetical protein MKX01_038670 [Papaver californicum]|nr:hypothetical protein MKX01_038670 [Papaver californicum]
MQFFLLLSIQVWWLFNQKSFELNPFRDVFDGYSQFELSLLSAHMDSLDDNRDKEEEEAEDERPNAKLSLSKLDHLIDRRPELANSVLLRQNPHNVEQCHRRVKLSKDNPTKQILTFTEAVRTVDPMKAVGNPHTLWISFAKLYFEHNDIANARVIFHKAAQVNYTKVDNLATVYRARKLLRHATAEPSVEVKWRVAGGGNEPLQMKLHKSVMLWTLYADLEEGMGTLESTRAVYGKMKLEMARELFEHAVQMAPADNLKQLYLQYAKLEEDHGLAKRAMEVYDEAVKALPDKEKLQMYDIYIARAVEFYGAPKTREIYEQAIESELPSEDVKTMCMKYADLEKSLGEIDRARGIYVFSSQFADPRSDNDFWSRWHQFELKHGNEDTFREMLQIKRSVSASYIQTNINLPENLMQKDSWLNLEETVGILKGVGDPEDEMSDLHLASASQDNSTQSGVIRTPNGEVNEVEITQRDVPAAVFGDLARKDKNARKKENDSKLAPLRK